MAWLIEAFTEPVNEGLLDRFKKKNKEPEHKDYCEFDDYYKYCREDVKKAYNEYFKVAKTELSKLKTDKVKLKIDDNQTKTYTLKITLDKCFKLYSFGEISDDRVIKHGECEFMYFDINKFATAAGLTARNLTFDTILSVIRPVLSALKSYQSKFDGVKCDLAEGGDWDDWDFNLYFTRDFFSSRIKE